jgi:hypothetical protein
MAIVDNVEQEPWESKCPCCGKELLIKWTMGYYEDHTSAFFEGVELKNQPNRKIKTPTKPPDYFTRNQIRKVIRKIKDPPKPRPRFTQALNPKTRKYVKIDTEKGSIVGHKRDGKPYKNIPIVLPRRIKSNGRKINQRMSGLPREKPCSR